MGNISRRFGRGFGLLAGLKEGKVSESGTLIGVLWPENTAHHRQRRLISRVKRRESVRVREGSWGSCSQKDLGRGARGRERRFRAQVREGLDIGNLLPFSSAFTEVIEIPENVWVECAIK
jgi:hypothetical protein